MSPVAEQCVLVAAGLKLKAIWSRFIVYLFYSKQTFFFLPTKWGQETTAPSY